MTQDRKLSFVAILMAVAILGLLCAFIVCVTTGCRTPGPGLTTNQIIIAPAEYSMPKLPPAQFNWRALKSEATPEPRTIKLAWDYLPEEMTSIVFRVYESDVITTDLSNHMRFLAETSALEYHFPAIGPARFYTVTASNTQTCLESGWAVR